MNVTVRKRYRQAWLWLGVVAMFLVGIGLAWLVRPASAETRDESTSVYYQVTYADGEIKDLATAPRTNTNILMVTKITQYQSDLVGYEAVSTGNQTIESLNPTRTVQTQLEWDGTSWAPAVKPRQQAPAQPAAAPVRPAGGAEQPLPASSAALLEQSLAEAARAIAEADQKLSTAAAEPGGLTAARKALARAMAALQTSQQIASRASQPGATTPAGSAGPSRDVASGYRSVTKPQPVLTTTVNAEAMPWAYPCMPGGWGEWGGNASVVTQQPNPDYDIGPRVIIREEH
jgi:hypothetical protein